MSSPTFLQAHQVSAAAHWSARAVMWAILIGLLLVGINTWWSTVMEQILGAGFPSEFTIPMNVVFLFFLVVLLEAAIRRWRPRFALRPGGLGLVYGMLAVAAVGASTSQCQLSAMIGWMTVPAWLASPDNRWDSIFLGYLPDWFVMKDRSVLTGFFEGQSSLHLPWIWRAWLPKMLLALLWSMLVYCLYLSMNLILRRRWMDDERLTFPVIQLPTALAQEGTSLLSNRLFWIAFAFVALIQIGNGLNFLYPSFPRFTPATFNLTRQLDPPWNASNASLRFVPFVLGLVMLMPLDLSFSCWFFYLLQQVQLVATRALALDVVPNFPHIREQSAAAFLAIAAYSLYAGRDYFRAVLRRALGLRSALDDSAEAVSYRWALVMFVFFFLGLAIYSTQIGLSPMTAVAFLLILVAESLAITRMRAQLGPPVQELFWVGPSRLLPNVMGPGFFRPRDLVGFHLYRWVNDDYCTHLMPHQLEAMKLGDVSGAPRRAVVTALLLALPLGVMLAFWVYFVAAYRLGVNSAHFNPGLVLSIRDYQAGELVTWLTTPPRPQPYVPWFMSLSFLLSLGLLSLRARHPAVPVHPMGYAMSAVWSLQYVWVNFFLAWLVKLLVVHHLGLKGYRQVVAGAFGLILGDAVLGAFWVILRMAGHVTTYQVWGWEY